MASQDNPLDPNSIGIQQDNLKVIQMLKVQVNIFQVPARMSQEGQQQVAGIAG